MDKRLQARRNAIVSMIAEDDAAACGHLPDFQQQIWFLQKMEPFLPMLNLSCCFRLLKEVDVARLQRSLHEVVSRHEILRASFPEIHGMPRMVVEEEVAITPLVADLSRVSDDGKQKQLTTLVQKDARQLFDLEHGPLLRCLAVELGQGESIVQLTIHHILTDGQAMLDLVAEELLLSYLGADVGPFEQCMSFTQFVDDYRETDPGRQIEFWKGQTELTRAAGELPAKTRRPRIQSYRGGRSSVPLDEIEHTRHREFAQANGVSPFALYLGAWYALMHRCTGETNLVCGSPFTLRRGRRMRRMVAPLIKSLPIRVELDPRRPCNDLLQSVSQAVRKAQRNTEIPFARLLYELDVKRDLSRSPLFQTQVAYLKKPVNELRGRDEYGGHYQPDTGTSLYDMSLEVEVQEDSTLLTCIYSSDLYSADDAEWVAGAIRQIIDTWINEPARAVGDLPIECPQGWSRADFDAPESETAFSGPLAEPEKRMARIWGEVLGVDNVDAGDSFFSIGGHSLLIPQLLMKVEQEMGVSPPLHALFEAPELRSFVKVVEDAQNTGAQEIPVDHDAATRELSFSQERIWFLHQLDEQHRVFNIPVVAPFPFGIDPELFKEALNEVVQTHDVFRCAFGDDDGRATRHEVDNVCVELPFEDLRGMPLDAMMDHVRRSAFQLAGEPFDLGKPPLIRFHAMQVRDGETLVAMVVHHLVADNWSLQIVLHDILASYRTRCRAVVCGSKAPTSILTKPPMSYAEFALGQRQRLTPMRIEPMLSFWRDYLAGAPAFLQLPSDHPRPPVQSFRGDQAAVYAAVDDMRRIAEIAEHDGASSFTALLSAFALLLQGFSGEDDLVIGAPVTDRESRGMHNVVGTFVNMLPIRVKMDKSSTFRELLRQTADQTLRVLQNKELPFDKLVERLNPERHPAYEPIYQVMFDLHIAYEELPVRSATHFEMPEINPGAVQCDLVLNVMESRHDDSLLTLQYNTDLFDKETATRLLDTYVSIIKAVAKNPDDQSPIFDIAEDGPSTGAGLETYFPDGCLHDLVSEQVRKTPRRTAIIEGDRHTSFEQLEEDSDGLARALAGKGNVVGVLLPRSAEAIRAILAILKTGGAYVVLDPDLPINRLTFIVNDAGVGTVVSNAACSDIAAQLDVEVVDVDTVSHAELELPRPPSTTAAAVIYTSGSTGRPRGIRCPHRGFVNRLNWMWREYPFDEDDVCCHKTSLNFVDAVAEIFLPLGRGVPLVVASDKAGRSPGGLLELIGEKQVTRLVVVPSLLRAMLNQPEARSKLQSMRLVVSSGEALRPSLAQCAMAALPGCRFLNIYGTTEVAADVTCHELTNTSATRATIPVGKPIDNVRVTILDKSGKPLPQLFSGEICLSGVCLADGYVGEVDSRFGVDSDGNRIFRTADIGRFNWQGELELLGRADGMLKLRGIRIAPEEVEDCLNAIPGIDESAVHIFEHNGSQQFVAFCRPSPGQVLGADKEMRSAMRRSLPASMVPDRFVAVDELPRTPGGKLDRGALERPPAVTVSEGASLETTSELEQQLIAVWEEYLGVRPIGRDDDFFGLGGHSLIAAEVVAKVKKLTGCELPLTTFFQAPTVADQAMLLQSGRAPQHAQVLVQINNAAADRNFFCFHGGFSVMAYHDLAEALAPKWSVYGLEHPPIDSDADEYSLESLVAEYVAEIRGVQPHGPYYLGGSSAAGFVAFEAAQQLVAAGKEVGLLAMFDSWGPGYPKVTSRLRFRASFLLRRIEHHVGSLLLLGSGRRAKYFTDKRRVGWKQLKVSVFNLLRLIRLPAPETVPPWAAAFWQAFERYEPKVYPGKAVLFRATKLLGGVKYDPTHGWGPFVENLDIREVRGFHGAIISEPRCRFLIEQLDELQ